MVYFCMIPFYMIYFLKKDYQSLTQVWTEHLRIPRTDIATQHFEI